MSKRNYQIMSQTIYNLLAQIILNGTNFVLLMIFTRLLSTDNYGTVSIYQAYVSFFSVIVGMQTQGSIGTAFVHIEKEKHKNYLASIMLLSVISFVVLLLICLPLLHFIADFSQLPPALIMLMLTHSFGGFCFSFANIKYTYSKTAQYSCLMAFIVSLSMILFSFGGSFLTNYGVEAYVIRILSLSVPYIICGIYVLISVFIQGNPFIDMRSSWQFCLPICLPIIFHGLSNVVLAQTDKIMLQKLLADNSSVGLYSFIVTFVHILNSIYIALNNTWVPVFYDHLKEGKTDEVVRRAKQYNLLFSMLVIGFILVAPEFVKLFADSEYWESCSLIPVIALSQYMVFLYSFAVNYEFYHRQTKWIAVGTTAAAICNIMINALLIKKFGMTGAAFATLFAYIMLVVFHNICAKKIKNSGYPFPKSFFVKNTCIVIAVCIFFVITKDIPLLRWGAAVIDGIILLAIIIRNKSVF